MSGIEQQAPAGGFALNLTGRAAEEVQKFIAAGAGPRRDAPASGSACCRAAARDSSTASTSRSVALEDDMVAEVNGVRVFVDGFSAQYLTGVTIDYVTSMQGSGFTFNNPNATGGCGCGSSFTA